jgi:hypothetical protein
MRRLTFPERAERVLIAALVLAILLIAQPWSIQVYRAGLILLVGATLLQIPVGNLPKEAGGGRSLLVIALILGVVAAVFGIGILLTPVLSQLGR